MSVEYWRTFDNRVAVVEVDDVKDTVEVSAPLLREMMTELGLTRMDQVREGEGPWGTL